MTVVNFSNIKCIELLVFILALRLFEKLFGGK